MSARRERGATLVEYALGVAAFVLVITIGLQVVQDGASQELASRKSEIADPGPSATIASTTSTPSTIPGPTSSTTSTTGSTTTTAAPTTTTTTPPSMSANCGGATCTFGVNNPPPGASYTWSTTGGAGSGTGPTLTVTRAKNAGGYTVTVVIQPGGTSLTRSVSCSNGANTVCTAS